MTLPDVVHELVEVRSGTDIQRGIRFAPVAISSRYDGQADLLTELQHFTILAARAHAIEFQRVDQGLKLMQETGERGPVNCWTHALRVPVRMIENHEYRRVRVELLEKETERCGFTICGECCKFLHPCVGAIGRQVMDAQVKHCLLKGHGPLHGNGSREVPANIRK